MLDAAFSIASLAAVAAWIGLAAATVLKPGGWRQWLLLVSGRLIPLGLCVAYVVALSSYWGSAPGGGLLVTVVRRRAVLGPGQAAGCLDALPGL
jgi:hypothetical protein